MKRMEPFQLTIAKYLGPYIKERRQLPKSYLGMSQIELANKLGISAQFLGRVEKGEVPIPHDLQVRMIIELKIPQAVIRDIYMDAAIERGKELMKKAESRKRHHKTL